MNNKNNILNNKKISVAMCTYNGERFVEEQLKSMLNQTYKNFEIIITDDGSSDNTIEIINKYISKDDRIKLYINENNLGFVKNFEKSISLCTGDYIALADQDDIWKINKLEYFIENIKENILIYSDAILIDDKGESLNAFLIAPKNQLVSGSNNKAFLLSNCVSGNTLMFKKELINEILPIPKNTRFHDMWIAFVASTYGSIIAVDEPMTYYRRYEQQITNKVQKEEYKGFESRLSIKEKSKIDIAKTIITDLNVYKDYHLLKNTSTLEVINLILDLYENYENINFSIKLYKILKKYEDEVFAIQKKKKRYKMSIRTSVGLKLHKKTLFLI